ncbi:MAG TPA: hypothetical protein VHX86_00150 [Tepidisphaeraceae bacterium]|jgi:hypothetical protein|nr:hypothetical protein [Tepidisphaeraceae bacterium]
MGDLATKFLGFDIEISNVFDLRPGEDIDQYAPFDISVAATHINGGEQRLWLSNGSDGKPLLNLNREEARNLLEYLDQMQRTGHALIAWNGLSFDLRWIGHVAGDVSKAAGIALKMYDPMFQFFKLKGFPVGLSAVAQGMSLATKKLMDGSDAPVQWRAGNHHAVCEYVMCDARMTVEIATSIHHKRQIAWVTQKGTRSSIPLPCLRTVEDCLGDPMPDQSRMTKPIPQTKFAGWLNC